MALIECKECGGKVSDKAASCPHCGCPIEKPIRKFSKITTDIICNGNFEVTPQEWKSMTFDEQREVTKTLHSWKDYWRNKRGDYPDFTSPLDGFFSGR